MCLCVFAVCTISIRRETPFSDVALLVLEILPYPGCPCDCLHHVNILSDVPEGPLQAWTPALRDLCGQADPLPCCGQLQRLGGC